MDDIRNLNDRKINKILSDETINTQNYASKLDNFKKKKILIFLMNCLRDCSWIKEAIDKQVMVDSDNEN